jgi:uncharacterized membrane protein
MGGFVDGILFHQVLQWHHLLSAVARPGLADLRTQVLADGLFHVLMHAIALTGLLLLLRARKAFSVAGAERDYLAVFLVGFGLWHVLDAVLFHWVLGIHHVRMDSASPLAWDGT